MSRKVIGQVLFIFFGLFFFVDDVTSDLNDPTIFERDRPYMDDWLDIFSVSFSIFYVFVSILVCRLLFFDSIIRMILYRRPYIVLLILFFLDLDKYRNGGEIVDTGGESWLARSRKSWPDFWSLGGSFGISCSLPSCRSIMEIRVSIFSLFLYIFSFLASFFCVKCNHLRLYKI